LYRLTKIEGLRRPPGIAAIRGTGVHKASELNFRQKIGSKQDMPVSDIQDAARDSFVAAARDGVFLPGADLSEQQTIIDKALDQTVTLAGLYGERLAPQIQPVMVEQWLDFQIPDTGIKVVTILDVLDESGWLPDLKTSTKSKSQNDADINLGLTAQSLALTSNGQPPAKISLENLVYKKTPELQSLTTTRTKADFDQFLFLGWEMLGDLKAGRFKRAPVGHWICTPKWCGFWGTSDCRYTRR
jgi:hypothetical protein